MWRLESLSEQVRLTCSCSLLAIFPPGKREYCSGLGRSSMGMLTPVNTAMYTQALLICPASHTDYLVFFAPQPQVTLVFQSCYMKLNSGVS